VREGSVEVQRGGDQHGDFGVEAKHFEAKRARVVHGVVKLELEQDRGPAPKTERMVVAVVMFMMGEKEEEGEVEEIKAAG